jgi:alpha-galactosidase
MLSKGTFLNLYTYGYDTPEAYAIAKDGKMYYAFFAAQPGAEWKGDLELRGLKPGSYHAVDYADGTDLKITTAGVDQVAHLPATFKDHLLLEVSAK